MVNENGYGFPDGLPTLPKLLHGAGYQTGGVPQQHVRRQPPGAGTPSPAPAARTARTSAGRSNGRRTVDGKRPYFLWVHLFGAHPPYYNGGDLARELDPGYTGPLGPRKRLLDPVMTRPIPLGPRDVRHLNALYDARRRSAATG